VEAKRYSPAWAKNMVRYLDRFVKAPIGSPMDVLRLFKGLSFGQQHQLNRALRAFFNFLEILGYDRDWLDGLRKAIPKDRVGIDIRVPEESTIREDLRRVSELALKYQALWHLCLDSGIRSIEAIHLINGFSLENLREVNGFYRYRIGEFRGSKQAYFAYFTEYTFGLIQGVNVEKISRPSASHYYSKYGCTSPKYLRKFAFDKMIDLEIPESVADFIEGRVPRRIGAKHYMALARQARKYYQRYADYISKLRQKALN
jgi:intergrase/recombinase